MQGLGLVFVAVYQRALKLLYVDDLLERVKENFKGHYKPDIVRQTARGQILKHACSFDPDALPHHVQERCAATLKPACLSAV